MNRPFGVPALAGPDRLKAGLQTSGVPTEQFMVPMHAQNEWGLSMNRPTPWPLPGGELLVRGRTSGSPPRRGWGWVHGPDSRPILGGVRYP